jgi:hypothetical protein
VVVSLAVLFASAGSNSLALAAAVLVISPAVVGATAAVTVTSAPLAIVPRLQWIVTVPVQLPWDEVAEFKAAAAGGVSVNTTPVAVAGPLLVTITV